MWQLEIAATNDSSGSTQFGLDHGAGTTCGDAEAGTTTPPSKVQVCSREYLPRRKSGLVRCHLMIALYSDITFGGAKELFSVLAGHLLMKMLVLSPSELKHLGLCAGTVRDTFWLCGGRSLSLNADHALTLIKGDVRHTAQVQRPRNQAGIPGIRQRWSWMFHRNEAFLEQICSPMKC